MSESERVSESCPWRKASDLHQKVLGLWRRYQSMSLDLMLLEGRVAELRGQVGETAKRVYELYRTSDDGLDGERPKELTTACPERSRMGINANKHNNQNSVNSVPLPKAQAVAK